MPIFALLFILTRGITDQSLTRPGIQAANNYSDSNYINQNKVDPSLIRSTSNNQQTDHPFTNALDGDQNTYWVGNQEVSSGSPSSMEIVFQDIQRLDGIIYIPYSDNNQYHGFPNQLKIYTQIDNAGYIHKYTFQTASSDISSILMKFERPLWCTTLKLEFIEVTPFPAYQNKNFPAIKEIYFLKAPQNFQHTKVKNADGKYDVNNVNYLINNSIQKNECSITGGEHLPPGNRQLAPIDTIFKVNNDYGGGQPHWTALNPNNATFKNSLTFNFSQTQCITSVLIWCAFGTNGSRRNFFGIATVLNVYAKLKGEDNFELKAVSTGFTNEKWTYYHYTFDPIWCDEMKIEFEEVNLDTCFSHDYCPTAKILILMKKDQEDNSPRLAPDNNSLTQEFVIENSKFENLNDNSIEFGGAILLTNLLFECKTTHFKNCHSNVGGGAIFVRYDENPSKPYKFESLTFETCESGYGGAICVISRDATSTTISGCTFMSNIATNRALGGSSIFLYTNGASIKRCQFTGNAGSSSIIRYANEDPTTPSSPTRMIQSTQTGELEVFDCQFDEEIEEGRFYVEVDEVLSNRISLQRNQIGQNEQHEIIHINKQSTSKTESKSKIKEIGYQKVISILVPCLIVVSLIIIVSIYYQHRKQNETKENNEETTNEEEI